MTWLKIFVQLISLREPIDNSTITQSREQLVRPSVRQSKASKPDVSHKRKADIDIDSLAHRFLGASWSRECGPDETHANEEVFYADVRHP